ncbi:GNAT family N-acetyltransferase [Pseudoneobacillus sp. C159]
MLEFLKFDRGNIDELVAFLTAETWPFHGQPNPTESSIRSSFEKGFYTEDGSQTFWVLKNGQKIGMVRLFDLEDPTCLFDIRLKEQSRGSGKGAQVVKWLTDFVFTHFPEMIRVEGHTRSDNYAMRKTFFKSGFVKEAYHRNAWPQEGKLYDSVGYAITRTDWENKTITEIKETFAY